MPGAALAVTVLAIATLEWNAPEREAVMARRAQIGGHLVGAGVMVAMALLGGGLNPALPVALIYLTFAVQVGINVTGRLQHGKALAV